MKKILHYFLNVSLVFGILLILSMSVQANGWEHFSIPLKSLLALLESDSEEIRQKAATALGIRREKQAVAPLLKALARSESSPSMRRVFYNALGKIGDPRATNVLLKALKEEDREELRADAASALGEIKDPASLSELLNVYKKEPMLIVRARIVDSLGSFSQQDSIRFLIQLLKGKNSMLRIRAIRSLGLTRSFNATQPLLNILKQSKSPKIRGEVIDALGYIGDPVSAEALTVLLGKTSQEELRLSLVVALGTIRDGRTAPVLIELLQENSLEVLHFAVIGIRKNEIKAAAEPLKRLFLKLSQQFWTRSKEEILKDPLSVLQALDLQVSILRTLIKVDPKIGQPVFIKGAQAAKFALDSSLEFRLNDAVYELRRIALVGLGYTEDSLSTNFLLRNGILQDSDPRLRAAAVRSLGVLGHSHSIETVIAMLKDDSYEVRWVAAIVLGRLKDLRVVEPLHAMLSDHHAFVREEAILSLGYLGDTTMRERIATIGKIDESLRVRQATQQYLQML